MPSWHWAIVALVVGCAAIFYAKVILVPLLAAFLVRLLFAPIVRWLRDRSYVPAPISAGFLVLFICIVSLLGIYLLTTQVELWIERGPEAVRELEYKLRPVIEKVSEVSEVTQELEQAANVNNGVEIRESSISDVLLGHTGAVAMELALMLVLLYFLLASDDLLLRRLVPIVSGFRRKRNTVRAVRALEDQLLRYVATVTCINGGLVIVLTFMFWVLGVPNPLFWAIIAGLCNYVQYIGPIVAGTLLAVGAVLNYDTLGGAAVPVIVFIMITALEGYVLTPMIVGRQLQLHPLMVLLSLMFWGWLWGFEGAILAMPLLVGFRIVSDYSDTLKPFGLLVAGKK